MPRQSATANIIPLAASSTRPKLTPLGSLTKAEAKIFRHTADQNPHLRPADSLLLELYAIAFCRAISAKARNIEAFERECRTVTHLAVKLRLTTQSAVEPKTVGRLRNEATANDLSKLYERRP